MAPASLTRAGLVAVTLLGAAQAQFVAPPKHLTQTKGFLDLPVRFKEVPSGICESTPGVKSFSGYVDIAEDQHIFFWFFEARNQDPHKAPLTTWINGGPGSSSMIGLFQENGPCSVNSKGDVVHNPFAWNNASNMLFIDHPAQVGFSYSTPIPAYESGSGDIVQLPDETCPSFASKCGTYSQPFVTDTVNTTVAGAPSFWKTLQGFMGAFPQYSRHDFHFTTESYGGHYGPIFNEYIESQNALIAAGKLPGAHEVNLKTVAIGNGWYDPLIQYGAYYNFTVFPGNTYDFSPFTKTQQEQMFNAMYGEGNCHDRTVMCAETGRDDVCSTADNFCATEVEFLLDSLAHRDEYDIRELKPDPFPYNFYVQYLNSPAVMQAIGAFVNFSDSSPTVGNAFGATGDDDREEGTVEAARKLVDKGVYVVQYAGDADYNCNWLGGQAVAEEIAAPGFGHAGFEDVKTADGVVHGQVKQSDNYAFLRVYESGHEVPFYQPALALQMFERAISGVDIVSGKRRVAPGGGYRTSGPKASPFREGKATVQFMKLGKDAIYNTTTNAPNPPAGGKKAKRVEAREIQEATLEKEEARKSRRAARPPMKMLMGKPRK